MKKTLSVILAFGLMCGVFGGLLPECRAADAPPPEGGVLPSFQLPVPTKAEDREYLGIKSEGKFQISQIKADIVIIEVFSMYCPFCQKEAPAVNELYQLVESREDLRGRVKMIGIGAGNSPFEVNAFRNLYAIRFPLVPDPDFSVHNILGQVRTPYFWVVRLNPDGTHKIVYSKVGGFGDPKQFLELLLQKADWKKEHDHDKA